MKQNKKIMSFVLCMMLTLSMVFGIVGCGDKKQDGNISNGTENSKQTTGGVVGEGEKSFGFVVVDQDGKETEFEVHTDKGTVGEALLELKLIDGEEGDFGLYVKEVNGITADYDKDGVYWAFYVDGEYATAGVDLTEITEGSTYSFKIEK